MIGCNTQPLASRASNVLAPRMPCPRTGVLRARQSSKNNTLRAHQGDVPDSGLWLPPTAQRQSVRARASNGFNQAKIKVWCHDDDGV
jgi:hypothetical protein